MLTQLSTVKSRLAIVITDYDDLLTNAIRAVSARFDKETNRNLARTTTATHEFDATDTEILPRCYPVESVTKFELKSDETDGWSEQTGVQYLIRRQCVISLSSPLRAPNSALCTARVQYAGGYVLPGHHPQCRPDRFAGRSRASRHRTSCILVPHPRQYRPHPFLA